MIDFALVHLIYTSGNVIGLCLDSNIEAIVYSYFLHFREAEITRYCSHVPVSVRECFIGLSIFT